MKDNESLKKLLALLIAARSAASNAAEPGVMELLDKAIDEAQQIGIGRA